MSYADTDAWKSISGQKISPNAKFLAYGLFPQEGDGNVVIRNLDTGAELYEPAGARPAPPAPDPERETPLPQRTTQITFSNDSRFVAFTTFPNQEELKKKASEQSKGGLVLVDTATMTPQRFTEIKNYQLPAESGILAFLKDNKEKTLTVLRLNGNQQKTIPGVVDYTLSKDGQTLVYATADAVLAMTTTNWEGNPLELLNAKGKYSKLTWDEKQSQLAFLGNDTVYLWDRKPGAARVAVSNSSPGLGAGFKLTEKGTLSFSRDGAHLFFPTALNRPRPKPEDGEKANYDLWHWKDESIQPMQKMRIGADRARNYRAVLHLAENRVLQLANLEVQEITPNENGQYAFGLDDRAYRSITEYDTKYADQYLINTLTGERKLLGKQRSGNYSWSPDGKYGLRFDSKDWLCLNVATGQESNLTAGLNANFYNEDYDAPGKPGAYGAGGWSRDGKYVLLYDRFDVWQNAPDGRQAKNLTDGVGRKRAIQFRIVRPETEERPEGFDPAKPLLLRAESIETRETGFFIDTIDGTAEPRQLIWSNKNFTAPVKAKNADVFLLTQSSFREYPDLTLTNSDMRTFQKVSDANPQIAGFNWGNSELMNFRSNDGQALKAAVYKPEDFNPTKKYPLLIYIYERLSQNVNTFAEPRPTNSINIPIYVSNGYIVLTPDISYRVGYPGDSAMNCVLPAIQKLIEEGYIDETRIGIQGHSWGGYQIAYMVTRTNLFKAAAPGAIVANMFSAYNGIRWGPGIPRQFQYERTQSRIGGTPWQYPLRFIENSPVFRADQVKTPLLMMHNDADDAVPWYQGIEFYLSLRRLNKEVYMFNYNGEPHNLRIRANQKHYSARLKEFFDYNLMSQPKPEWMEKGRSFLEKEPTAPARSSTATEDEDPDELP
ncbi:prolyl oligopeptidase family serine peptidase [Bryobacter aggregatus]|uniref:prolyl oligopeptidase family serine peptidase n=1 Tax=Bryobacter aggregatus TaxID=360054 RepID=UPI0012BA7112|nr:prolyl oligopeptidase family serine peptidase [Bryobacter aggregatus]